MPYSQADETNWHYVDCTNGSIVAYAHGTTQENNAYTGGVYDPTTHRIYLAPRNQGPQTNWSYIADADAYIPPISATLMSGALFNKY